MARSATEPQGIFRALQLLLSPFVFAAKAATILLALLIAAVFALSAMFVGSAEPSDEVRKLMSRFASTSMFQGLAPTESCRSRFQLLGHPSRDSCSFEFGKTTVRVSWSRKSGRVVSVSFRKSVADNEQASHQSAPLAWLDFPEVHRLLCPNADAAAVVAGMPQRLAQANWTRWDGTKSVPAESTEQNATRLVLIADAYRCRARLEEKRDKNQVLQVTLNYRLAGRDF